MQLLRGSGLVILPIVQIVQACAGVMSACVCTVVAAQLPRASEKRFLECSDSSADCPGRFGDNPTALQKPERNTGVTANR